MPNTNPRFERTYTAPGSYTQAREPQWKYEAATNTLWLKLNDGTDTAWYPIQLGKFPQSVDHTGAA